LLFLLIKIYHHHQDDIVSKRLDKWSWFLAWMLLSTHPTLRFKEICVSPKIIVLQQRVAGLLLCARRVEDVDRLMHAGAKQHSAQQQMRAMPRFQRT